MASLGVKTTRIYKPLSPDSDWRFVRTEATEMGVVVIIINDADMVAGLQRIESAAAQRKTERSTARELLAANRK